LFKNPDDSTEAFGYPSRISKTGSSSNFVEISSRLTVRLDVQRPDSMQAQPGSRVARKDEAGAGLGAKDKIRVRAESPARSLSQEFLLGAWQRTFSPSVTTAFNKD
jgi:hypothetical protein